MGNCYNGITENSDYTTEFNFILNSNKYDPIKAITICRTPLQQLSMSLSEFVSLGKIDQLMKVQNMKIIYHTFIKIETSSGMIYLLQKESDALVIKQHPTFPSDIEYLPILSSVPFNLILQQVLDNTRNYMGNFKYFNYDLYKNNCQDFIFAVITANGFANKENVAFIKQNTDPLFINSVSPLANLGTDALVMKDKIVEVAPIVLDIAKDVIILGSATLKTVDKIVDVVEIIADIVN
jgi:hypothetical protein